MEQLREFFWGAFASIIGANVMAEKRRSIVARRSGKDRRSGVDTRSDQEKAAQGERRLGKDRRTRLDRRSTAQSGGAERDRER